MIEAMRTIIIFLLSTLGILVLLFIVIMGLFFIALAVIHTRKIYEREKYKLLKAEMEELDD